MSFLKKYKKQFDSASEKYGVDKYMPKDKKEEEKEKPAASPIPETAGLTPAVPPNWTATWSAEKSHWVYTDTTTGATQLTHPDPANYGGQSAPPGGPVLEADGKPKKDKEGMLIGAAGGLATGAFGKKLLGGAKKKAMKQAGMGKAKHGGGSGSSSSSSSSDAGGDDAGQ
ncbi:MAG: hypothetical protein M1828_001659 [Chrysothrix sp. TS-e1954]|nr:MAG: hypothetical protein M1828_001659 [Chrysothrix sp. TS-e1954]